jgi:hypothetical protein
MASASLRATGTEIAGALNMITVGIMTETGTIGATTATIMTGETTTTTIASQF